MTRPDLTDEEIDRLCSGLQQNAAKVRFLARLGLHVTRKPNGRPMVMRAHAERVLAGAPGEAAGTADQFKPQAQPNRANLVQLFARKAA